MPKTPSPRDVVVVRVSSQGGREGEHFHSPEVQAEAAERWAKTRRERIVAEPFREIDVSGKLPLASAPARLPRSRWSRRIKPTTFSSPPSTVSFAR
jgi:hypothetical protein